MSNRITSRVAQRFVDELSDQFLTTHRIGLPPSKVIVRTKFDLNAGTYDPNTKLIRINRGIMGEVHEKFMKEILAHEFAHHVVESTSINRVSPHGNEWKKAARFFGAFPRHDHYYPYGPLIANNLDKFCCYETNTHCVLFSLDTFKRHGMSFTRKGVKWSFTEEMKQYALDHLLKTEREITGPTLKDRMRLVNVRKTFWREYEREG